MDKMFDYESLFAYMSLIFSLAIFIILLYGCLSVAYSNKNIERFSDATTTVLDVPVMAIISNLEVNATGEITKVNMSNKGKYYNKMPPTITFTAPPEGTIAEATVTLETTPVTGTNLYEIKEIAIKPDKKGTKYTATSINLITLQIEKDYIDNANKENPLINLTSEQKKTITDLIDGCASLTSTIKTKYKAIINSGNLRQYVVDDIIKELENAKSTTSA